MSVRQLYPGWLSWQLTAGPKDPVFESCPEIFFTQLDDYNSSALFSKLNNCFKINTERLLVWSVTE